MRSLLIVSLILLSSCEFCEKAGGLAKINGEKIAEHWDCKDVRGIQELLYSPLSATFCGDLPQDKGPVSAIVCKVVVGIAADLAAQKFAEKYKCNVAKVKKDFGKADALCLLLAAIPNIP